MLPICLLQHGRNHRQLLTIACTTSDWEGDTQTTGSYAKSALSRWNIVFVSVPVKQEEILNVDEEGSVIDDGPGWEEQRSSEKHLDCYANSLQIFEGTAASAKLTFGFFYAEIYRMKTKSVFLLLLSWESAHFINDPWIGHTEEWFFSSFLSFFALIHDARLHIVTNTNLLLTHLIVHRILAISETQTTKDESSRVDRRNSLNFCSTSQPDNVYQCYSCVEISDRTWWFIGDFSGPLKKLQQSYSNSMRIFRNIETWIMTHSTLALRIYSAGRISLYRTNK